MNRERERGNESWKMSCRLIKNNNNVIFAKDEVIEGEDKQWNKEKKI